MSITFLLLCSLIELAFSISKHPILIVVSYDAFRYNYFNKHVTPYMEKLRNTGTYADYLENVFPTKTFPNHHSISTGLYPEVHGIVGNTFYDPKLRKVVKFSYEMWHYNEQIEPIWRYNERLGDNRHSGVMMWPGGIFPYQNMIPTYIQNWDPMYNWYKRIDTAVSWIIDDESPANLVMIYIEEPDTHGHAFGPESNEVTDVLRQLDNITNYLDLKLKSLNLDDKVTVIHLSDHGMSSIKESNIIDLTGDLPLDTYYLAGSTPCLHIVPHAGYEDKIYDILSNKSKKGNFKVYRKNELLDRWHMKNNPRTPPIFALADVGYGFQDLSQNMIEYSKNYKFNVTGKSKFGAHGYDNQLPDMRPFFMVRGPKIKKNHKVSPFKTVDLFNLFCAILEIEPLKNNGTLRNIQDVFITGGSKVFSTVVAVVGGILVVLLLVSCAFVITIVIMKTQRRSAPTTEQNKRLQQNFQHSIIEAQHLLEPEEA